MTSITNSSSAAAAAADLPPSKKTKVTDQIKLGFPEPIKKLILEARIPGVSVTKLTNGEYTFSLNPNYTFTRKLQSEFNKIYSDGATLNEDTRLIDLNPKLSKQLYFESDNQNKPFEEAAREFLVKDLQKLIKENDPINCSKEALENFHSKLTSFLEKKIEGFKSEGEAKSILKKSLNDKGVTSGSEIDQLEKEIKRCELDVKATEKKIHFLHKSFESFLSKMESGKINPSTFSKRRLEKRELLRFETESYLREVYSGQDVVTDTSDSFYDYKEGTFADFAGRTIGSGAFQEGFLQDERMMWEFFQLIYFLFERHDIFTETIDSTPDPIIFANIYRTISIHGSAYGQGKLAEFVETEKAPLVTMCDETTPISVVSMKAERVPKLNTTIKDKVSLDIFKKNFTFILAAVMLDRKINPFPHTFNTGWFGCGDFNNDHLAIYLLQRLAVAHKNDGSQKLKFFGFKGAGDVYKGDKGTDRFESVWQSLKMKMTGKSLENCLKLVRDEVLAFHGIQDSKM